MTLAVVYSRACSGITAPLVTVEVHLSRGIPRFSIVGLPETAVQESKERVRCALLNTAFEFPARRITVNLAPADLPKEGGRFDLAIAIGILAASSQIPKNKLSDYELTGELALTGELRAVRGTLSMAIAAHQAQRKLIIPVSNAQEASLARNSEIYTAQHILEVCAHFKNENTLPACEYSSDAAEEEMLDLADVQGQIHAKRALEIAAAGKHNLLLIGPPGTGKTMLASRLGTLLPELSEEQALEVAAIASLSSEGFKTQKWARAPFRTPHHSSSGAALIGGGRPPRPGEISLAHHGVLFLDELPEFNRKVLECLREPLEAGCISLSRAAFQAIFPANFQLIAAMNPCPCGYNGSLRVTCRCTEEQIQRYLNKISGPLLDRIDMQIEVSNLLSHVLTTTDVNNETSNVVRTRVKKARTRQLERQNRLNKELTKTELDMYCSLDTDSQDLLLRIIDKFNLSPRSYHRVLKVARTISDLADEDVISIQHLSEALSFRYLDRLKIANY